MQPLNNKVLIVEEEIQKIYDSAIDIGKTKDRRTVYHIEYYDRDRLTVLESIQRLSRELGNPPGQRVAVMEGMDEMKALSLREQSLTEEWQDMLIRNVKG